MTNAPITLIPHPTDLATFCADVELRQRTTSRRLAALLRTAVRRLRSHGGFTSRPSDRALDDVGETRRFHG